MSKKTVEWSQKQELVIVAVALHRAALTIQTADTGIWAGGNCVLAPLPGLRRASGQQGRQALYSVPSE